MNVVMKANPIGLVVTAVAALVTGLILLAKNVKSVGDFFVWLGGKVKATIDFFGEWKYLILALLGPIGWLVAAWDYFFGEQAKALSDQQKAEQAAFEERTRRGKEIAKQHTERLKQLEEERDALERKHKDDQEDFDFQIKVNDLLGKSSRQLTKQKLQDNIDFNKEQSRIINEMIAEWTAYYEDLFVLSGKSREDFIAQMKGQGIDLDALLKESQELQEKANRAVQLSEAELINFQIQGSKKVKEEKKNNEKESVDNTLKEQQRLLDRRIAAQKELDKLEIANIKDAEERKRAELMFAFEESIAQLDSNIEEENLLILAREQELQEALTQVTKDAEEERAKERREQREKQVQQAIDSAENLVKAAESINTIFHGRELKRIEEKKARGEQLTKSEIKRLQREEKVQKAFALAQVAVDTARGISSAVAAGAGLIFPANLAAIISGVSAVLAGVAQAAQILGSSSSIDAGVAGDVTTIEDAAGGATENAPIDAIQEGSTLLDQQPQQVVVVEAITEGIKSVDVIEQQATFGG
jgi:hypothetical protein